MLFSVFLWSFGVKTDLFSVKIKQCNAPPNTHNFQEIFKVADRTFFNVALFLPHNSYLHCLSVRREQSTWMHNNTKFKAVPRNGISLKHLTTSIIYNHFWHLRDTMKDIFHAVSRGVVAHFFSSSHFLVVEFPAP